MADESVEIKRVKRGLYLREDLYKQVKQTALDQDRTVYEVIEAALTEYFQESKWHRSVDRKEPIRYAQPVKPRGD